MNERSKSSLVKNHSLGASIIHSLYSKCLDVLKSFGIFHGQPDPILKNHEILYGYDLEWLSNCSRISKEFSILASILKPSLDTILQGPSFCREQSNRFRSRTVHIFEIQFHTLQKCLVFLYLTLPNVCIYWQ